MKKVLITMAVLTSMVAGGMVFSSFTAPRTNDETVCSQINANDGWTRVGDYYGYDRDGNRSSSKFTIWERKDACNSYYWVYDCSYHNPDQELSHASGDTGVLRQNSERKWYAAYKGTNYFIDF